MRRTLSSGAGRTHLGVEHEYRLWSDGTHVDFRRLIGRVCGDLRTLDPGDPRARRLPSGVALTADGWEAELATPPLPVGPRLPGTIDRLLRAERTELRAVAAPEGVDLITGFSTHLNITVPDDEVVSVGVRFAEHCLAALAEVMEPDSSSGMFVRPRRGRLEIGGEYAEGLDLEAALTLLIGCVETLRRRPDGPGTKPHVLEPSREKFGWYAADLRGGRLGTVWSWARVAAVDQGLDPAPVDDLVAGRRVQRRHAEEDASGCTFDDGPLPTSGTESGHDVAERVLPAGVRAETVWLTWHHVVWMFQDRDGRRCRAVVPVREEPAFLAALDEGEHDLMLKRLLRRSWPAQRLLVHAQLGGVSWWHDVRPGALVPAERLPDGSLPRVSRRRAARFLRARTSGRTAT